MGSGKRQTRAQTGRARAGTSAPQRPFSVQDILYTNHATASHEREAIEASILDHRQLIDDIDGEIEAIFTKIAKQHAAIGRLKDKRHGIERMIKAHDQLLLPSHMRALPTEILAEIFLAFCETSPPSLRVRALTHHAAKPFYQTRMRILCVCHRWRAVALSVPRLWDTFYVVSTQTQCDAGISRSWMQCAASIPLSLSYAVDHCADSLQLVMEHLPRCRELQLRFEEREMHDIDNDTVDLLLTLSPSGASALTSLTIVSNMWEAGFFNEWMPGFLSKAPHVTSLTTDMPSHFLAPLAGQLLHLSLVHKTVMREAVAYLEILGALQSLHIHLTGDADGVPPPNPSHVFHPSLRSIYWFCDKHDGRNLCGELLDSLTLPLLSDIDINLCPIPLETLTNLFKRSSCKITSLSLWLSELELPRRDRASGPPPADASKPRPLADDLLDLLSLDQVNNYLQRLTIIEHGKGIREGLQDADPVVLSALAAPGTLPSLTHLRLAASSLVTELVEGVLENRITSLGAGQARLKHFVLHHRSSDRPSRSTPGPTRYLGDSVNSFRGKGVLIDVVYRKKPKDTGPWSRWAALGSCHVVPRGSNFWD